MKLVTKQRMKRGAGERIRCVEMHCMEAGWPDCWINLRNLCSVLLVSGSLFYPKQLCNSERSPPEDRPSVDKWVTDPSPVCG